MSFLTGMGGLTACTTNQTALLTVADVDLNRFAGSWYVIANIPTFIETQAYNAIEHYSAPVGNRIETQFTFNDQSLDGPKKTYKPTAFVSKESNAVWGMQFIWPIKAEYRIVHLDSAYQFTIIGRTKRDYVWIMARSADISTQQYQALVDRVESLGYDITKLRRIPHATNSLASLGGEK